MCSLLGLNLLGMDQVDTTNEVSPEAAKAFRTRVGILLYLACDLPHCQHIVRHLSTYSTQPMVKSMTVLKHLVAYLASHDSICISLKWKGRTTGLFHSYNTSIPGESVMEIFTDSDWASDRTSRRSVSCATIFFGGCLLYSCSRTQKLVSLSSAEAEVYACSSGTSDGILLCRLVEWMAGFTCSIHLHCDSSAARGIIQRQGVGRVRHLSCRILWLQSLVANGIIKLACVAGATNPADIGTKRLPSSRLRSLMGMIGMFNMSTGLVEGADDPGRIYSKKQNMHAILSVLSLLTLKGCAEDDDLSSSPTVGLLVFTLVFGFCCTVFWMMVNGMQQNQQAQNEPDAEPMVNEEVEMEANDGADIPASEIDAAPPAPSGASSSSETALTAENYVAWLLERCCRRRDQTTDGDRRRLYEERVTILFELRSALASSHAAFRESARRTLGNLADISDDEESPNYEGIHGPTSLGQAQRALAFINALQSGSASSTGFSTNVDMVANDLGRNATFPPHSPSQSSSGAGETRSEAMERYMSSRRSDVSDPSLWNYLHFGDEISDESENNET